MANSSTIGASATAIASFVAFIFTINGFIESGTQHQPSITYSGQAYAGFAVMAWFGVICLAISLTGIAYSIKRIHFALAVTAPILLFISGIVEIYSLMYAPAINSAGPSLSMLASAEPSIIAQMLFALGGIFFSAASKKQFNKPPTPANSQPADGIMVA